jgi:glyoxylase-like metal-dependent hydrolase (beta-lactamase superfamily II)
VTPGEPVTLPAAAALPLPGGSPGATVRLHPLRCGDSLAPPGWTFRHDERGAARRALGIGVPQSEWETAPMGAFLLEHPTVGPILIDTGLHSCTAERLRDNFGRVNAFFFRTLRTSPQQSMPAQLQARGIDPTRIELVVMTHLHVDHASAMSEFPAATFICTLREWQAASARFGEWSGYVRRQLPAPSHVRTIDLASGSSGRHGPFDRTVDLLGDGSIRLLDTPGHTAGHVSVLARLTGREALLAGDAIYTMRNLREGLLPWRTIDDDLYRRSVGQLREYAEQNPDALVIPTHDADVWDRLDERY